MPWAVQYNVTGQCWYINMTRANGGWPDISRIFYLWSVTKPRSEKCCCSRHKRQQQQQQSWSLHTVILQAARGCKYYLFSEDCEIRTPVYRAEKYSDLEQWFILLTRGQIYCLRERESVTLLLWPPQQPFEEEIWLVPAPAQLMLLNWDIKILLDSEYSVQKFPRLSQHAHIHRSLIHKVLLQGDLEGGRN